MSHLSLIKCVFRKSAVARWRGACLRSQHTQFWALSSLGLAYFPGLSFSRVVTGPEPRKRERQMRATSGGPTLGSQLTSPPLPAPKKCKARDGSE